MALPLKLDWPIAQTRWKSQLDPLLANSLNNVSLLSNISLAIGANTINHLLGRAQQGWFLVDIQGAATVYRSQPFNSTTLTLTSSAPVTVSIGVY